jgi:hypothetical protein
MKKEDEKLASEVYETFNYDQFSILPENRGHIESKGIKEKKIKVLQRLIDEGIWIDEVARVKVNEKFEIIDGAHTFEVLKRNQKAIRYEIIHDAAFNSGTKRDKIGAVYSINSVTTTWSPAELFNAAVVTKAPLALILREIIEKNDNYFLWTDLIAILEKDSNYFMGRWRKASMQLFERKDLIEQVQHETFTPELNFFIKLNQKARIAQRKGLILKAAYDILWNARHMIEPKLMRKALASLPESSVSSNKMISDDACRRMIIQHYNKSQGQAVETATIMYALKHKDQEQVLEIS